MKMRVVIVLLKLFVLARVSSIAYKVLTLHSR